MYWALKSGNFSIFLVVLDDGVKADPKLLYQAAREKQDLYFSALFKKNVSPYEEKDMLFLTALVGNLELFNVYLEKGFTPDKNVLDCAAQGGNIHIFNAVLAKNITPDHDTVRAAIIGGNFMIFCALMSANIGIDFFDLAFAVKHRKVAIVEEMMRMNIEPNVDTIYAAAASGDYRLYRAVMKDLDQQWFFNGMANHAAKGGNLKIFEDLVKQRKGLPASVYLPEAISGKNLEIVTMSAMHQKEEIHFCYSYAVKFGSLEMFKVLLELGQPPTQGTLQEAVRESRRDFVMVLLAYGLLPDEETMQIAQTCRNRAIQNALLNAKGHPDPATMMNDARS